MPTTIDKEITNLSLDLKNFRTTPQPDEIAAVKAMISIKPERFYAVLESIIENGYLPTENIIVINNNSSYIVREGNRRIAVMKLIHGQLPLDEFIMPAHIKAKILGVDSAWKLENITVPCSIYELSEASLVEKIVSLTHAKGEKASRDPWSSVARARYDRDTKGLSVPSLDILEKYIENGQNISGIQKQRWSGDYPITVLDEALRKIYPRFKVNSTVELAAAYPKIELVNEFEEILLHIGSEVIRFETIRNIHQDFAEAYSIFPLPKVQPEETVTTVSVGQTSSTTPSSSPDNPNTIGAPTTQSSSVTSKTDTLGSEAPHTSPASNTNNAVKQAPKAIASNDPKHVSALLRKFIPRGNNRHKVALLRDELRKLKIVDNPIAFCLLLRSIFEISAKIYCEENEISITKQNGSKTIEKTLNELLTEVTSRLTKGNSNKPMVKVLHGASTEMSQPGRILSVTSMNQLVHNPSFSVATSDICTAFSNIYPLLEAMN